MEKTCFKCGEIKNISEFYKHGGMIDGHVNKCKECNKEDVRKNYYSKKEKYSRYDKWRIRNNADYIFLHRYSGMLSRVEGRGGRPYSVMGKEICSKEEFIGWCNEWENMKMFLSIWTEWSRKKFIPRLSPSIDRIDNNKGYTLDNIMWLSKSENSKKYNK